MNIILCHIIAFIAGYILDLIIGDPHSMPHPVRLIGRLISLLDRRLNTGDERQKFYKGILTVLIVTSVTVIVSGFILAGAYFLNIYIGIIAESIMTYQILAGKSLRDESMKVYDA
ncbi:MAG: cobalamin biosynthesis protein, partial [Lachnospiraceae bacterium]|nr:cobalamin biosynthesis protein [Lachnospiraceae bacterium]